MDAIAARKSTEDEWPRSCRIKTNINAKSGLEKEVEAMKLEIRALKLEINELKELLGFGANEVTKGEN